MTGIVQWQMSAEFERLALLNDEDYQHAAALGIEKQEEKTRKHHEEMNHSLDSIADQVVDTFTDREYHHYVLKDWCKDFKDMLQKTMKPDWNPCEYEPNCKTMLAILNEVKSRATKEKVDTLFETSFRSGKNRRLKSEYRIETIKAKLKTPFEARKTILKEVFVNLKRPFLNNFVGYAAITEWYGAVRPMFESTLDNRADWDKVLFLVDTIKEDPVEILDMRNNVRPPFATEGLPVRLGIDYRPGPRVTQERRRKRDRFNPFSSHSLALRRRIGRRQAAIRGVETFGEAQDGGLLLP